MEELAGIEGAVPKFYGVATVGERGQVVIPAEARRDLGISPSTKLLVFGTRKKGGLILTKAEFVSELLARAMEILSRFEKMLEIPEREDKEG